MYINIKKICLLLLLIICVTGSITFSSESAEDNTVCNSEKVIMREERGKEKQEAVEVMQQHEETEKEILTNGEDKTEREPDGRINNEKSSENQSLNVEENLQKNKIWVVDRKAYDEEVENLDKPVYEYVKYWFIRYDDGRFVKYYDEIQWDYITGSDPEAARWGGPEYEERIAGYEKEIIHHNEEGHWEYR